MDIDKIINAYRSKVNADYANPQKVAQAKDDTLKKIENAAALSALLGNIRTAYDMISDAVTGRYKGIAKSTLALLAGGLAWSSFLARSRAATTVSTWARRAA